MMRFRRPLWRSLGDADKSALIDEASVALRSMTGSAIYSLLGHKGDLMLIHFRKSFEELNQAELQLARLGLSDYLEPTSSYLSVVELGLYESTLQGL